jgi:hypothetical protein
VVGDVFRTISEEDIADEIMAIPELATGELVKSSAFRPFAYVMVRISRDGRVELSFTLVTRRGTPSPLSLPSFAGYTVVAEPVG